ncbi:DNA mismatch repair protein msh6 [Entomortierella beljakovae]|nr:DNA mismatch repair protein msh6 [Entomortierella beljakovae]
MTSDARLPKSPARPKSQNTQPPMMQQSIQKFFIKQEVEAKPTPIPVKVTEDRNQFQEAAIVDPSLLFTTDEVVLKKGTSSKRKTIDFDNGPDDETSEISSKSVKKFAAQVEKLTLSSPVKRFQLDKSAQPPPPPLLDIKDKEDEEEEEDLSLGSRRSSRGVGRTRVKYQISDDDDDDDDVDPKKTSTPRRKTKIEDDDDDDSEYEAPAAVPEDDFNMDLDGVDWDESILYEEEEDILPPSPTRYRNTSTITKGPPSPKKAPMAPAKTASIFNKPAPSPSKPAPSRPVLTLKDDKKKERAIKFEENNSGRYKWLLDIKDADGNPIGSPDYDPRTLYIPARAWGEFTDFERQFWEIKGKHFDSVVFFKKGKFYELYENDADIGHQKFDLKLTDRTNMRMVGVPESSFEYWAAQFIAKGFKVARVDQMETALGKAMRERDDAVKKSAVQKVIRRELHSILTAGTLTDSGLLTNEMATYCMAIKELNRPGAEHLPTQFGIAFVDTSTAEFNLATFYDDMDRTKFETLITQIKPKEIVIEKGGLSVRSTRILKNSLGVNSIWNNLKPESEFWGAMDTADELRLREYFGPDTPGTVATACWPAALQKMNDHPAAMSALGGLVWYLRTLKLDKELLSFKNFHIYDPVRQASTLILDGQTLSNLEIFQNNNDGSETGTVLKLLNRCVTPFGKRLFRRWLCHPLRSAPAISARLDAVEDLMRVPGFMEVFEEKCARFPDLERIVSRIHAGSSKISEFLVVLSTFRSLVNTVEKLTTFTTQFKSKKLESVLAELPDLTGHLEYFSEAFDHRIAATEGEIMPYPGFAEDYDTNSEEFKRLDAEFAKHLEKAKRELK